MKIIQDVFEHFQQENLNPHNPIGRESIVSYRYQCLVYFDRYCSTLYDNEESYLDDKIINKTHLPYCHVKLAAQPTNAFQSRL